MALNLPKNVHWTFFDFKEVQVLRLVCGGFVYFLLLSRCWRWSWRVWRTVLTFDTMEGGGAVTVNLQSSPMGVG